MVKMEQLVFRYTHKKEERIVLDSIDLRIPKGERVVLIGPSGCGKSTLLNLLAGIYKPTKGKISWENSDCLMSYMPQSYGLLPWKSVYENCLLPYRIKGIRITHQEEADLNELLERLEIMHLKKRYPSELSGGQRQRVALARALVIKPQLLLMDEPFSALDAYMREEAMEQFLQIWKHTGCTAVIVTHSIEEALYMGDYLVMMQSNPGKIQKVIENPFVGIKREQIIMPQQETYQKLFQSIKEYLKGA